ncbi:hypothetical protein VF673_12295 [Halopseudomonas sp. Lyrl_26]|uniref:hypothetical protein n=1 Tax=Halopseudomonas sp. Lyrl_26 TaxID=3110923 RepID=UPI003F80207B
MSFLSVVLFFLTFYKISLFHSSFYLTFVFSVFFIIFALKGYRVFFFSIGLGAILSFLAILFFSLSVDAVTGSLVTNFTNSFAIRSLSIILISAVPAFLLVFLFLKFDYDSVLNVIVVSFWVQFAFWLITFLDPEIKFFLTGLMGGGIDAVNLREHNLHVRGFGLSNEINFTTPFVMVLVSFLLVKRFAIGFVSTVTQLVNSNLVVVAILIGVFLSKASFFSRFLSILVVSVVCFFVYQLGDEVFPRLFSEFGGDGSRTVRALIDNHVIFLNNGVWGHLFGEGVYVFQGGFSLSSDIGWIHMYNYGGVFFTLLFVLFMFFLSVAAFGKSLLGVAWFGAGLVLNTKGLLFGPNAFFFVTFIFIFLNYGKRLGLGRGVGV